MPDFKLGDIVETIKGAKFWGEIIAFDNDEASPGCTVRAIDPGFLSTKHVYPIAVLRLRTAQPRHAADCPWDRTRLTLERQCTCGAIPNA